MTIFTYQNSREKRFLLDFDILIIENKSETRAKVHNLSYNYIIFIEKNLFYYLVI